MVQKKKPAKIAFPLLGPYKWDALGEKMEVGVGAVLKGGMPQKTRELSPTVKRDKFCQ